MTEVAPGLWIGGQAAADAASGYTHVLSVVNYTTSVPAGVNALHIDLEDSEDANLLQHLTQTTGFIRRAVASGGKVLVHCNAGTSRSVAVATAYLMACNLEPADEALHWIKQARPGAQPNAGFMAQLQLWGDMGFKLEPRNAAYKRFVLEQVGKRWAEDGYVDRTTLATLPDEAPGTSASFEEDVYRCRKCRRLLVTSSHIVPPETHVGGDGRGFRDRKSVKGYVVERDGGEGNAGGDSSVFVQPMQWMGDCIEGEVQGKLYCPGCSGRLGSFNWSGIRDTSGAWVTPAFQLHLSRMDCIHPQPLAALAAVRHPVVLPSASSTPAAAD